MDAVRSPSPTPSEVFDYILGQDPISHDPSTSDQPSAVTQPEEGQIQQTRVLIQPLCSSSHMSEEGRDPVSHVQSTSSVSPQIWQPRALGQLRGSSSRMSEEFQDPLLRASPQIRRSRALTQPQVLSSCTSNESPSRALCSPHASSQIRRSRSLTQPRRLSPYLDQLLTSGASPEMHHPMPPTQPQDSSSSIPEEGKDSVSHALGDDDNVLPVIDLTSIDRESEPRMPSWEYIEASVICL